MDKAHQMNLPLLHSYFFCGALKSFLNTQPLLQDRPTWLQLTQSAKQLPSPSLIGLGRSVLELMLVLNHHLVRDIESYELEQLLVDVPVLS